MGALPAPDVARLARLAGMLGSTFDGERANAAALATRELQRAGLTWSAVIERAFAQGERVRTGTAPAPDQPADDVAMLQAVRVRISALSDWEISFTENLLSWRGRFTPKQRATLRRIHDRVVHGGAG